MTNNNLRYLFNHLNYHITIGSNLELKINNSQPNILPCSLTKYLLKNQQQSMSDESFSDNLKEKRTTHYSKKNSKKFW